MERKRRRSVKTPERKIKQNVSKLDVPLECQDPEEYGNFDKEQMWMMNHGALDLVLIENASELARLVMMDPGDEETLGSIENVLYHIAEANSWKVKGRKLKTCGVLSSETFPLQTKFRYIDQWSGTKEEYDEKVQVMKTQLKEIDGDCVFAVLGVRVRDDPNDSSGHYASFCFDRVENKVFIFDAMQGGKESGAINLDFRSEDYKLSIIELARDIGIVNDFIYGDLTELVREIFKSPIIKTQSEYSMFFRQLAFDIFGAKSVEIEPGFNLRNSLQLTGGFSSNSPLSVELTDFFIPDRTIEALNYQSTESQNHFCYMWALWSIHIRMTGRSISEIANFIYTQKIDPLIVIKRYMWSLFTSKDLKLIDKIPKRYLDFFKRNFPVVWSNDPVRQMIITTHFERYAFPVTACPQKGGINTCLEASMANLPRLEVQMKTPNTPQVEETVRCMIKNENMWGAIQDESSD
jgi:hypothetical protein